MTKDSSFNITSPCISPLRLAIPTLPFSPTQASPRPTVFVITDVYCHPTTGKNGTLQPFIYSKPSQSVVETANKRAVILALSVGYPFMRQ